MSDKLDRFRTHVKQQRNPLPRVTNEDLDNVVIRKESIEWYSPGKESNPSLLGPVLDLPTKSFEIFLQEIEAGTSSDMQCHHHESVHYVISGQGYSQIGDKTYQWSEGDFIYTPPMVWHRHYNSSAEEPVKMLLVENSKLLDYLGLNYRVSEGLVDYEELQERIKTKSSQI